jgi:hypothetical protein
MGQSGREMASPSCGRTWPRNASQPLLTQSVKSSRCALGHYGCCRYAGVLLKGSYHLRTLVIEEVKNRLRQIMHGIAPCIRDRNIGEYNTCIGLKCVC